MKSAGTEGRPPATARPWLLVGALRSTVTPGAQWRLLLDGPKGSPAPTVVLERGTLPSTPNPAQVPSPTHALATVQAGLLRGQLANQQGLQELPDKVEVRVEGVEGILGDRGTQVRMSPSPLRAPGVLRPCPHQEGFPPSGPKRSLLSPAPDGSLQQGQS